MRVIVDGYNLLFAWGWVKNKSHPRALIEGRQKLLEKLAHQISPAGRKSTVIVFDAKSFFQSSASGKERSSERTWGFDVRFAQSYDEADTMIEELIRRDSNPKKLTIVSSDQRLIVAAQRRGCRAIRSQDWFDQLDMVYRCHPSDSGSSSADDFDRSNKDQKISDNDLNCELQSIDWMTEFNINEIPVAEFHDPPVEKKLQDDDDDDDLFNPFPPGYGEDLLE